jgi:uncharacterized protein with PIN domain
MAMIDFDETEEEWWKYSSTWMLLTRDSQLLDRPDIKSASLTIRTNDIPLWSDDFASLFQILKK